MRRLQLMISVVALVSALAFASAASGAYVYVTGTAAQRGVGAARLNMADNTAKAKIYIPLSSYRPNPWLDTNYAGRQVYVWRFGARMSNGRYPVMMYAYNNYYDNVFHFTVNSSAYKTPSGVGVGSTGTLVKSKYRTAVVLRGSVYTIFRIRYGTSRPYSDFVVRNSTGRVDHISIYK